VVPLPCAKLTVCMHIRSIYESSPYHEASQTSLKFAAMKISNYLFLLVLSYSFLVVSQDAYNAIRNTLAHYPLAIDGKQFSDLSLIFTPDAVANVSFLTLLNP
jgi:hypothetical protein